jgi:hypothetical protein
MYVCTCIVLSRHIMAQQLEMYLFYFSHLLMLTSFVLGTIINLLPIYRLSCFVSSSLVIFVYIHVTVLTL